MQSNDIEYGSIVLVIELTAPQPQRSRSSSKSGRRSCQFVPARKRSNTSALLSAEVMEGLSRHGVLNMTEMQQSVMTVCPRPRCFDDAMVIPLPKVVA